MTAEEEAQYNISIHVPRVEDDPWHKTWRKSAAYFNPRPPCGGRLTPCPSTTLRRYISIHVPRVEDDAVRVGGGRVCRNFNPRPPCGGRLHTDVQTPERRLAFQSTSPVWRTTDRKRKKIPVDGISIHVPRVEDDAVTYIKLRKKQYFNPRPPCGGRPGTSWSSEGMQYISIHVPRVEDDRIGQRHSTIIKNFNPRPPCGGRRESKSNSPKNKKISIHVPRVEDDEPYSVEKTSL